MRHTFYTMVPHACRRYIYPASWVYVRASCMLCLPAVVGSQLIMHGPYPSSNATLSGGGGTRSMCVVLCESRGRAMSEATTDQETGPTTERKPIGGNEADFEAVLIDGILGFSLSIGNAILLLVGAVSHAGSFFDAALMLVISALVAALFFKAVQLRTDTISSASTPCSVRVSPCALLPHIHYRDVPGASIRHSGCRRARPG